MVVQRRIPVILGLLGLISCGSNTSSAPVSTSTSLDANATLVRTVDGDTIDVKIGESTERVRLLGINTPESVKRNSPVECFGKEASKFAAGLLSEGTELHLERDVEARDAYGRLLAYVYRLPDGMFVNLELVRQGYAQTLTFPPNVTHADEFVEAARQAERANLGLWGACGG